MKINTIMDDAVHSAVGKPLMISPSRGLKYLGPLDCNLPPYYGLFILMNTN